MVRMKPGSKVFVAGHRGMVGSAIVRCLQKNGFENLVLKNHSELDLTDQAQVNAFFKAEKPDFVFVAAARVGGIVANSKYIADFLYENLMIASNVIHAAHMTETEKLLFLGSTCIYPRNAEQPMKEEALLTGSLEPTNEGYAIAKIAGLKLCEMYQRQYGRRFISAMPTNLYGPGDNFHPENSHVIPGMMRRFYEAKQSGAKKVIVWGSGSPVREFLHADDLAEALILLMQEYEKPETVNVGTGTGISIAELAVLMKKVTGFEGSIEFDTSKPDGTPKKVSNVERILSMGWAPSYDLESGLRHALSWATSHGKLV